MENIMTLFKSSDAFQQLEKNKKAFGVDGLDVNGIYKQGEKYGILNTETGERITGAFADSILSNGVFEINYKYGLVNFKTGEILKQPFADIIFSSGVYEIGNREGRINLKTGETIE